MQPTITGLVNILVTGFQAKTLWPLLIYHSNIGVSHRGFRVAKTNLGLVGISSAADVNRHKPHCLSYHVGLQRRMQAVSPHFDEADKDQKDCCRAWY